MNQTTDGKKKDLRSRIDWKGILAVGVLLLMIAVVLYSNTPDQYDFKKDKCTKWNVTYDYNGSLGDWSGIYWDAECDGFCRTDDVNCSLITKELKTCTELYNNRSLLDWENLNLECIEWKDN